MVNQWEYEVFAYHHKQKHQGEADSSRMLNGIKEKTLYNDFYPRSKIDWLIEQLAGDKVKR